jgi:hypothetical protein
VIGGLYLCFEGVEKSAYKFWPSKDYLQQKHAEKLFVVADPNINLVFFEKVK